MKNIKLLLLIVISCPSVLAEPSAMPGDSTIMAWIIGIGIILGIFMILKMKKSEKNNSNDPQNNLKSYFENNTGSNSGAESRLNGYNEYLRKYRDNLLGRTHSTDFVADIPHMNDSGEIEHTRVYGTDNIERIAEKTLVKSRHDQLKIINELLEHINRLSKDVFYKRLEELRSANIICHDSIEAQKTNIDKEIYSVRDKIRLPITEYMTSLLNNNRHTHNLETINNNITTHGKKIDSEWLKAKELHNKIQAINNEINKCITKFYENIDQEKVYELLNNIKEKIILVENLEKEFDSTCRDIKTQIVNLIDYNYRYNSDIEKESQNRKLRDAYLKNAGIHNIHADNISINKDSLSDSNIRIMSGRDYLLRQKRKEHINNKSE